MLHGQMDPDLSYLDRLPPDAYENLIDNSDNFEFIIALYLHKLPARQLLDCQRRVTQIRLLGLVNDITECALLPTQEARLSRLNEKFHLRVFPPLSFAKLMRAYTHSAHNPRCAEYEPIVSCLKSAARLGLYEQLFPTLPGQPQTLYDLWLAKYLQIDADATPESILQADWYAEFMKKLAGIAYKNKHPFLGDALRTHILSALPRNNLGLGIGIEYAHLKHQVRLLLAPYKVKTSRDIRREHYKTLYSTDVSDEDKQAIWATKYDLTNFQVSSGNVLVDSAVLLKLGKPVNVGDLKSKERMLLSAFAAQSGSQILLNHLSLRFLPDVPTLLAIKRGYYSLATSIRNLNPEMNVVTWWTRSRPLLWFFNNFALDHVRIIIRALDQFAGHDDEPDNHWVTLLCIDAGADRLCHQLPAGSLTDDIVTSVDNRARISRNMLPIWTEILRRLPALIDKSLARRKVESWLGYNGKLLADMWKVYGRRQFEDTLIYLQVHFQCELTVDSRLIGDILSRDALSLLAYVFGYRLVNMREVAPLIEPGLMKFPEKLPPAVDVFSPASPDATTVVAALHRAVSG